MDPARILVVDDDSDTLCAVTSTLENRLYNVRLETACSAPEAFAKLSDEFDVLLTDVKMPGETGLELAARVRKQFPDLPVLVMSGHDDEKATALALKNELFGFMGKPLDRDQLTIWMKRAIEFSRLKKQAKPWLTPAIDNFATTFQTIIEGTEEVQNDDRVLNDVIDTAPCLVVLTDAEGRIVLFNRFAEQTTGCFRQSVIGRNIVTFIPETWKPIVLKRFADPSAAEVRAPHQNPWLDQTGKEHMIEWRCTPFSRPGSDKPWILGVGIPVEGTDSPERFTRITLS